MSSVDAGSVHPIGSAKCVAMSIEHQKIRDQKTTEVRALGSELNILLSGSRTLRP